MIRQRNLLTINIKLPFIWSEWGPKAYTEYLKEVDQWEHKDEATRGAKPSPRMLETDVDNFLKLATAMKIVLARSVRVQDIPRAKELLFQYLKGFHEVRRFLILITKLYSPLPLISF